MTQSNNFVNISGLKQESLIDGMGVRTVIYFQGCSHKCPECQNPHTQPFTTGKLVSIPYILNYIKEDILSTGVTFSGGCPMCQYNYFDSVIELAKKIKDNGLSLWCYCGETFEELKEKQLELLKYIDVLVDGRFEIDNRNDTIPFRGSTNQRLIDVQKSLQKGEIVIWKI